MLREQGRSLGSGECSHRFGSVCVCVRAVRVRVRACVCVCVLGVRKGLSLGRRKGGRVPARTRVREPFSPFVAVYAARLSPVVSEARHELVGRDVVEDARHGRAVHVARRREPLREWVARRRLARRKPSQGRRLLLVTLRGSADTRGHADGTHSYHVCAYNFFNSSSIERPSATPALRTLNL